MVDAPAHTQAPENPVMEQAAIWFARLDCGDLEQDEHGRLQSWLAEDAGHGEALLDITRIWGGVGAVNFDNLEQLASAANDTDPPYIAAGYKSSRLPRMAAGLAAAFALLFVVWTVYPATQGAHYQETVQTAVGGHRIINLPDGSQIELNTDTVAELAFSDTERIVKLGRGEAYFKVATDPDRPFIVETKAGSVRAVGTEFNIHVEKDGVEVIVAEGVVEVGKADTPVPSQVPVKLVAGQHATLGLAGGTIAAVKGTAAERQLSWRDNMLLFDGDPLEDVLVEVGRYTPQRITIADDELRTIRIGGVFKVGEVDTVLGFLNERFSVRAERVGPNEIRLHKSGS